jgi:outer membrane lipoprotein-sorting protein
MAFLRRVSTRQLILLCAAVLAVAGGGTALALAAGSSGPKPPAKPLPVALRDALSAPKPNGVTARITFTNHLLSSSSFEGSNPILAGATGRLWASADGRFRLELQSGSAGDTQVVSDGTGFWAYDASSNTVYRGKLPQHDKSSRDSASAGPEKPPALSRIESALAELGARATVSGAKPGNVGGLPAYTVTVAPKHDGGLVGSAALAWDAARGVPLRVAVYARGHSGPVLELKATHISFGPVASRTLSPSLPAGAKTVDLTPKAKTAAGAHKADKPVAGLAAVRRAVHFKLTAPSSLAGLPRQEVRLLGDKAVVTYGHELGSIVVIQQPATKEAGAAPEKPAAPEKGGHGGLSLPKISIKGATGQELDTALGTVIRFERAGVTYTVFGSVPPAAAQAAARAL